jgi:hypothetical protein
VVVPLTAGSDTAAEKAYVDAAAVAVVVHWLTLFDSI